MPLLSISLTPNLRVRWSQIDGFDLVRRRWHDPLREQTHVTRGQMVGRLILCEDLDSRMLEISTKSYRPVTRGQRADGGGSEPVPGFRGRRDHRPPRAGPARVVERREDLPALRVDHRQPW